VLKIKSKKKTEGLYCSIKQHIARKPHHTGIKFWAAADENTYLYWFTIYTGKETQPRENKLGFEIVASFVSKLPDGPYTIFGDSFFGSIELVAH